MDYFAGLDISMDETHVCIVDREGVVVRESKTASTAGAFRIEPPRFVRPGSRDRSGPCRRTRRRGRRRPSRPWDRAALLREDLNGLHTGVFDMTTEESLSVAVRGHLSRAGAMSEVKMFGGTGFMLNGKLVAGVSKRGLLLRVGKDRYPDALGWPGARPWR